MRHRGGCGMKKATRRWPMPAMCGHPRWGAHAAADHLILVSLYATCLRATGSYFLISIFSGIVRLFFVVV